LALSFAPANSKATSRHLHHPLGRDQKAKPSWPLAGKQNGRPSGAAARFADHARGDTSSLDQLTPAVISSQAGIHVAGEPPVIGHL
jgi:hypothetical protein